MCIRKKVLADQNNDIMDSYCLWYGRNTERDIQMAEVSEMLLWYEGSWKQQDVGLNLDSMLLTILDLGQVTFPL